MEEFEWFAPSYAISRNEREMGWPWRLPCSMPRNNKDSGDFRAGSTERFDTKLDKLILEVRRAAASVSERLSRL